jgi:hypothetical protein
MHVEYFLHIIAFDDLWLDWLCRDFSQSSRKRDGFREKCISRAMCFHFLFTFVSLTFLLRGKIRRDIIINYLVMHVKYQILFADFTQNLIFWTDFNTVPKIKILRKSFSSSRVVPRGGRTYGHMTDLLLVFRHFANAPTNTSRATGQNADYRSGKSATIALY